MTLPIIGTFSSFWRGNDRRWLLRGESAVAAFGISLAAILLATMGAWAWWTWHTQEGLLNRVQSEQLQRTGATLCQTAETMLRANELSAVRRLVVDAGREHHLNRCRIVLGDGRVLADAEPARITVRDLPAHWSGGDPEAGEQLVDTSSPGEITFSYPLTLPGRGQARFELGVSGANAGWAAWHTMAGIGVIGSLALAGLLWIYRRMRARLSAMEIIRQALLAAHNGEQSLAALSVQASGSDEAAAWNQVLAEREQLRQEVAGSRIKQSLQQRRSGSGGKGDLDGACEAMSQGLLLIDERCRVTYANGAAAVLLRAKRDELNGAELGQMMQSAEVLESVRGVISGAVRRRTTIELQGQGDGGGHSVLRVSVRPVRRDDAAAAMIMVEDITQQRVAEESRNAFVAQATHELRTPLSNIRLYVEQAIEDGQKNPGQIGQSLNVINQESRRLERIVGEMLSVAEIEAGSFKLRQDDVRLDELFKEMAADFEPQAREKQLDLSLQLPPKLPVMRGDRDKITLALHNLVGNALKYTPSGGRVTVTVEADEKRLEVAVRDTGIGIAEKDLPRIFERFYRADDPRLASITGSGLGLTLAREVVRRHGGEIVVESQINQGSTFTLRLPLSPGITAEAA